MHIHNEVYTLLPAAITCRVRTRWAYRPGGDRRDAGIPVSRRQQIAVAHGTVALHPHVPGQRIGARVRVGGALEERHVVHQRRLRFPAVSAHVTPYVMNVLEYICNEFMLVAYSRLFGQQRLVADDVMLVLQNGRLEYLAPVQCVHAGIDAHLISSHSIRVNLVFATYSIRCSNRKQ